MTSRNDTLHGKVKIQSFDMDQAQIILEGKKTMFPAHQIKTLRVNDVLYGVQKRLNQYRIMTLLKSGYLSIYGFHEPNQRSMTVVSL